MKKITLIAALLGATYFAQGQVGIGTPKPKTSSYLDVDAKDKGILIPRVALTSATDFNPITGEQVESLLVYNTTDNNSAIPKGFYYWKDEVTTEGFAQPAHWERIATGTEMSILLSQQDYDVKRIKELLSTAYPSNNLGDTPTNEAGGGMVYEPAEGGNPAKMYYVTYVPSTDPTQDGHYEKVEITQQLADIISLNETKTILRKDVDGNGDYTGTYTYFNEDAIDEDGNPIETEGVTIDVPGDVINHFQDIINEGDVIDQLTQVIKNKTKGNVTFDGDKFYYVDDNGDKQPVDLSDLVKSNETITTIVTFEGNQYYLPEDFDGEKDVTQWTAPEDGAILIDVVNGVTNNIGDILNKTVNITEGGKTYTTVKEYLQHVTNGGEGNMVFVPGTGLDDSSFTYVDENGDTQTITFDDLVKGNETETTIGRSADGAAYAPVTTDSKGTGKIVYEYLAEGGVKNYMDITADVLQSIQNNPDVIEEITNIMNEGGGNVYFTENAIDADDNFNTAVPAKSLYRIVEATNGDKVKTPIDIASNIVNAITNATTQQINNIKKDLGDVINNNSNTSVFTGDTYVDNGTTYYIYKGSYETTITANEATTTGVTLDKRGEKIMSLVVNYNNGLTASVTDVVLNGTALGFNIGTGNRYEVLSSSPIDASVTIEFASAVTPDGL